MKGKYVVGLTRAVFSTTVAAVIFPETMVHADVAERLFGGKSRIIGAGFFHVDSVGDKIELMHYGRSDSLNIHSRVEDKGYLEQALGLEEFLHGPQLRADLKAIEAQIDAELAKERAKLTAAFQA